MSVIESTGESSDVITDVDGDQSSAAEVPLFLVSAYQDEQKRQGQKVLPKLPSHRFRFSVWHDVTNIHVTGDKLKAPRVREGPPTKEEIFYRLRDENDKRIHHNLRGRQRMNYQREQENWEQAQHVNLAYQELEHAYQRKALIKVLMRLERAEEIVLFDNGLTNLSSVTFPKCTQLNLTHNYITSFHNLPKMPHIRMLNLDQNDITDFTGLKRFPSLEWLSLRENPVAFTVDYRKHIFAILPQLKFLDCIPKLEEDTQDIPPRDKSNTCTVS